MDDVIDGIDYGFLTNLCTDNGPEEGVVSKEVALNEVDKIISLWGQSDSGATENDSEHNTIHEAIVEEPYISSMDADLGNPQVHEQYIIEPQDHIGQIIIQFTIPEDSKSAPSPISEKPPKTKLPTVKELLAVKNPQAVSNIGKFKRCKKKQLVGPTDVCRENCKIELLPLKIGARMVCKDRHELSATIKSKAHAQVQLINHGISSVGHNTKEDKFILPGTSPLASNFYSVDHKQQTGQIDGAHSCKKIKVCGDPTAAINSRETITSPMVNGNDASRTISADSMLHQNQRARHFNFICLQIGQYVFVPNASHKDAISRLKVIFTSRKLVYEYELLPNFHMTNLTDNFPVTKMISIEVPMDSIKAMRCNNEEVLIKVDTKPAIYSGCRLHSDVKKCCKYETYAREDVTAGQLDITAIHKILLSKCSDASMLQLFLIAGDAKLNQLFVNPMDSITRPLKDPSSPSLPLALHGNNYTTFEAILRLNGIFVNENCDDPCLLEVKQRTGVNILQLIPFKKMACPSCHQLLKLSDYTPGVRTCPNPSCKTLLRYSWCKAQLYSFETQPERHCVSCKTCVISESIHCEACSRCFLPRLDIKRCPHCASAKKKQEKKGPAQS